MQSETTRRYEMGLPLFSGLDLGLLLEAQAQIERKEFKGLSGLISTLAAAGTGKTIRKLAAIYRATEVELKAAEANSKTMAELEERTAEVPFNETFRDAMAFLVALLGSLGLTPDSSGGEGAANETTKAEKPKARGKKASESSPSEG